MPDNSSSELPISLPPDAAAGTLLPQLFKYDLFLSYSTKPDYRLARDIERFIESFHEQKLSSAKPLRPLMVCRDGSEFILKKSADNREKSGDRDEVWSTILPYLEQSNYLLLLACPQSSGSTWVTREIAWFLDNRPGNVWIAVTSGRDGAIDAVLPPAVVEHEIDHRIWFDFRAYQPGSQNAADTPKVFEDELVRLVANLHDISSGELLPIFQRDKRETVNRRRRTNLVLAGIGIGLLVIAGVSIVNAVNGRKFADQAMMTSMWKPRTLEHFK